MDRYNDPAKYSKGALLPPPQHINYYTFILLNSHFLQNSHKNSNSYCTSPKTYQYKNEKSVTMEYSVPFRLKTHGHEESFKYKKNKIYLQKQKDITL